MIKITDPNMIQKRERELLDAIADGLNQDALIDVLKEQHRLHTISGMESRHGDIVAVGNMVAYRLDFDVRTVLSILFDRSGNYVEIPSSSESPHPPRGRLHGTFGSAGNVSRRRGCEARRNSG